MRKAIWYREVLREGKRVKIPMYRRTLAVKGKRVEPEQILKWIETKSWPYTWNIEGYRLRDKALISLTYLLCGRIGEVLRLEKTQFKDRKNFLVVENYVVEKNSVNPIRDPWGLPKKGRLSPFTNIIIEYLNRLPKLQTKLFRIGRVRAWQIIRHVTGKWSHWLRAMGEAYYMRNVFKEPVKCAAALRLRRSDTLIEYVPFEWSDYEKQLSA